jgi:hypothetical protein
MNFEKHGPRNYFAGGHDGGVVAFEMADLQNAIRALGGGDKAVSFADGGSHGLFHEDIHAGIEKIAADATVFGGGNGEANGVDFFGGERVYVANHARLKFGGNLSGAFGVGINNPHEFGAFHLTPDAGMIAPKFTDADDCNSNGILVHDFLFEARAGDSFGSSISGANA